MREPVSPNCLDPGCAIPQARAPVTNSGDAIAVRALRGCGAGGQLAPNGKGLTQKDAKCNCGSAQYRDFSACCRAQPNGPSASGSHLICRQEPTSINPLRDILSPLRASRNASQAVPSSSSSPAGGGGGPPAGGPGRPV